MSNPEVKLHANIPEIKPIKKDDHFCLMCSTVGMGTRDSLEIWFRYDDVDYYYPDWGTTPTRVSRGYFLNALTVMDFHKFDKQFNGEVTFHAKINLPDEMRLDSWTAKVETGTPTPERPYGCIKGNARVRVTGLPSSPKVEKEVIFCLESNDSNSWVNVRHRSRSAEGMPRPASYYQLKGGIGKFNGCGDETHVFTSQPASNGVWEVMWNRGAITVTSPSGHLKGINLPDSIIPVFDRIKPGASAGGYVHESSSVSVEVLEFNELEFGNGSVCPDGKPN